MINKKSKYSRFKREQKMSLKKPIMEGGEWDQIHNERPDPRTTDMANGGRNRTLTEFQMQEGRAQINRLHPQ